MRNAKQGACILYCAFFFRCQDTICCVCCMNCIILPQEEIVKSFFGIVIYLSQFYICASVMAGFYVICIIFNVYFAMALSIIYNVPRAAKNNRCGRFLYAYNYASFQADRSRYYAQYFKLNTKLDDNDPYKFRYTSDTTISCLFVT